jgi:hypothetical protein
MPSSKFGLESFPHSPNPSKIEPNLGGVLPDEGGPCLATGTSITTPDGSVCVEDLSIGSLVVTAAGIKPIRWIGKRSYSHLTAVADRKVLPIRIRRNALGDNLPRRDLWVSPEHAMFVDGMLIPAALLVNEVSILQEKSVDALQYFHLEFDAHTIIYAEGAPTESFADDDSRTMFDNAAEYDALYPGRLKEPATFCAPRVEDGEELENVRRQLAQRAKSLTFVDAGDSCAIGQGQPVARREQDRTVPRSPSVLRVPDPERTGHGV